MRRMLGPYVDGELVGEECRRVEDHLSWCSSCAAAFHREVALASDIETALSRAAAPHSLQERVEATLARHRRRGRRWTLPAAGLAAALAVAAAAYLLSRTSPGVPPARADQPAFVSVAVDSHLRYARGQLPLEVHSDRPDVVSRWFAGRVPFNVALPDYPVGPGQRKPYSLEGGRLVALEGDYAAYVAYRMEGRPISLLVTSSGVARPSGSDTVVSGGLRFHIESVAGLKVITWTDNGLTYALASDLSVSGERTCLVCHGDASERAKLEGLRDHGPTR